MESELPLVALPAWDWQVGTEHAQGADGGHGQQGRHRLFSGWYLLLGPQCGFASPETIELRGATACGSADGSSHLRVCPVGLFVLVLQLSEHQVRSTDKFPEGDEPSLLCCFVLCGFSLPLLTVLIPQLCVVYL